jgi:hypothetical protein
VELTSYIIYFNYFLHLLDNFQVSRLHNSTGGGFLDFETDYTFIVNPGTL